MKSTLFKSFAAMIVAVVLLYASGVAPAAYNLVMQSAVALTRRSTINFTGAGVTCADDAGNSRTNCTVAGGTAGEANGSFPFTGVTSLTITNAQHGFGQPNLIVSCYDNSSPPKYFEPTQITIDSATYQIDVTFSESSTGHCVVNGGSGVRSIASGSKALAEAEIASEDCTAAQTDTATGAFPGPIGCIGAGNPLACCTGAGAGATCPTDVIQFTPDADITAVTGYAPVTTGGLAIYPYVTLDTVNFKVCNPTSAPITPGAVRLNWKVPR